MKKILITGAQSYIGMSFESYVKHWPEQYQVDTLDMREESWREHSFSGYDAVFHVAGLVHMPKTKNSAEFTELYEAVNTRLAVETAEKAKAEGVKQFLFMSSASVYGVNGSIRETVMITRDTPLAPTDNYGISKKQAEEGILPLNGEGFKVAVLRPPMIYGRGCKGNYVTLSKLAKKLPVFPYVENRRSMLYIDNLSEFVRQLVDAEAEGVFCPQNNEYTNTSEMVRMIAQAHGKQMPLIKGFGWALKLLSPMTSLVDKAFGSLCYDYELSRWLQEYCVVNLAESVKKTEAE